MEQQFFLNRIKESILSKDSNAEVYLYGSRARGEAREDSDWDILVISNKEHITFEFENELHDPIYDIELESGQVISLLVYSKKDWNLKHQISPLFQNVKKEGYKI